MATNESSADYPRLLRIAVQLTGAPLQTFLQTQGLGSLSELQQLAAPADPNVKLKTARGKYGVAGVSDHPSCRYRNLLTVASKIQDAEVLRLFLQENSVASLSALREAAATEAGPDLEAIEAATIAADGGKRQYRFS